MPGISEAVPPLVMRECCAADGRLFTFVDLAATRTLRRPRPRSFAQVTTGLRSWKT